MVAHRRLDGLWTLDLLAIVERLGPSLTPRLSSLGGSASVSWLGTALVVYSGSGRGVICCSAHVYCGVRSGHAADGELVAVIGGLYPIVLRYSSSQCCSQGK